MLCQAQAQLGLQEADLILTVEFPIWAVLEKTYNFNQIYSADFQIFRSSYPLRSSCMEVVFHLFKVFQKMLGSTRLDLQWRSSSVFPSICHFPLRSSSIFSKNFKIVLSSTRVDLQMLQSKFC